MSCPDCGAELAPGQSRCAACGASAAPATEGSLAPDPLLAPPTDRVAPLREIPGLRRKEKSWKDEVRERVRHRKRERDADALPLFREEDATTAGEGGDRSEPAPADPYATTARMEAPPADEDSPGVADPVAEPAADLPLRPAGPARAAASGFFRLEGEEGPELEPLEPTPPGEPSRPVERPAGALDRLQAAALDLALLLGLWSIVLYGAGRAARVAIPALLPAWPYLCGYLAFLGLTYAAYFTGTTGQTLGKIALGLRVVDTSGRPPGYLRALVRATLGTLGIALAGAGLVTILFDPARRAFHDRLLRTRVVK